MNLILGLLWLLGAVGLFAYEFATGEVKFRIRWLNVSSAWLLLLLAAYNFARWYSARSSRDQDAATDYVARARLHQAQRRERVDPDPTFDFTDKPDPPRPGEPSNN